MNPLPGPCPYAAPNMRLVGDRTLFCANCQKEVHDLRGESLLNVIRFAKENPTACIVLGGTPDQANGVKDSTPAT
jgi:hypothetical protein